MRGRENRSESLERGLMHQTTSFQKGRSGNGSPFLFVLDAQMSSVGADAVDAARIAPLASLRRAGGLPERTCIAIGRCAHARCQVYREI